ncbi:hypothetical protein O163_14385 [Caldanaerobacter subterraneus subsp. yonseiensis KB-1]|nr:hypothetical protein O163_14385 [Caldanaerobacter subterraneus subsp. yonseiensis KB-1]
MEEYESMKDYSGFYKVIKKEAVWIYPILP